MDAKVKQYIDQLEQGQILNRDELLYLLNHVDEENSTYLFEKSCAVSKKHFGNKVYIRGLIEFSNFCKNDCLYCGIRRSNKNASRYRLTKEQIMFCCRTGYDLGFRTYVLQGGEDPYYTDEMLVDIIKTIKADYPDCAITLSIGEREMESYKKFRDAGADRFLLRHETANGEHYQKLHPENLTLEHRIQCLYKLKELGYQVGTGFMVGSPYQTTENLVEDLLFISKFKPHMIGIGPFIPHKDTPFHDFQAGTLEMTLFLIGILRLMNPNALIPSTTALGTIHPLGREKGILAGANVVMPNLSPVDVRSKYMLYDNKICTGEEAAECNFCLRNRMKNIGYELVTDRGDYKEI